RYGKRDILRQFFANFSPARRAAPALEGAPQADQRLPAVREPEFGDPPAEFGGPGNSPGDIASEFRGMGNSFPGRGNEFRDLRNEFRGSGNEFRGLGKLVSRHRKRV